MARIGPTRGRPEFPPRGPEGKVSPELKRNRDLTMNVAGKVHLEQFEPTGSLFSAGPAGNIGKTREAVDKFFGF